MIGVAKQTTTLLPMSARVQGVLGFPDNFQSHLKGPQLLHPQTLNPKP